MPHYHFFRLVLLAAITTMAAARADLLLQSGTRDVVAAVFQVGSAGPGSIVARNVGAPTLTLAARGATGYGSPHALVEYVVAGFPKVVANDAGLVAAVIAEGSPLDPPSTIWRGTPFDVCRWIAAAFDSIGSLSAYVNGNQTFVAAGPLSSHARYLVADASGATAVLETGADGRPHLVGATVPSVVSRHQTADVNYVLGQIDQALEYWRGTFGQGRQQLATARAQHQTAYLRQQAVVSDYFNDAVPWAQFWYKSALYWQEQAVRVGGELGYYTNRGAVLSGVRDKAYDEARRFFGNAFSEDAQAAGAQQYYLYFVAYRNWGLAGYWAGQYWNHVAAAQYWRGVAGVAIDIGGQAEAQRADIQNRIVGELKGSLNTSIQYITLSLTELGKRRQQGEWDIWLSQQLGGEMAGHLATIQYLVPLVSAEREQQMIADLRGSVSATWGPEILVIREARTANSAGVLQSIALLSKLPAYQDSVVLVVNGGQRAFFWSYTFGNGKGAAAVGLTQFPGPGSCGVSVADGTKTRMDDDGLPPVLALTLPLAQAFGGTITPSVIATTLATNYPRPTPGSVCPAIQRF